MVALGRSLRSRIHLHLQQSHRRQHITLLIQPHTNLPFTPIRTRARAAAEAQALSASTSSILTAPAPKKRKRDLHDEVRAPTAKKPALGSQQSRTVVGPSSTDSRSGAVTEDVCLFCTLCASV